MYRGIAAILLLVYVASIKADGGPDVPTSEPPVAKPEKPVASPEPVLLHYAKTVEPPASQPVTPPTSQTVAPPPSQPDLKSLDQQAAVLRAQREKLNAERAEQPPDTGSSCPSCSDEIMKARLRLAELLTKIQVQRKQETAKAPEQPKSTREPPVNVRPSPGSPGPDAAKGKRDRSVTKQDATPEKMSPVDASPHAGPKAEKLETTQSPKTKPFSPVADLGKPVDPMLLAQSLFQTGDYEGALGTYRLLDLVHLGKTDRAATQYFMATCLRRLGKFDEAAALYREVVNSKDDDILADCAQWQLGAFRWRRELETQLEQMRQRRQAVEASK